MLTFSVVLLEAAVASLPPTPTTCMSGWLLKKKRKRIQGWAKRWFVLSSSGVLSYSVEPNSIIRGSLQIMVSAISSHPKQRLIHIDSGTTLYHLKTFTVEEHTKWLDSLKAYHLNASEEEESPKALDNQGATVMDSLKAGQDIKTMIESGIQGASHLDEQSDAMAKMIYDMEKQIARAPDPKPWVEELKKMADELAKQQKQVSATIYDQQRLWKSVQETYKISPNRANRRSHLFLKSPSIGLLQEEKTAKEGYEGVVGYVMHERGTRSQTSLFSDQFFDAEDTFSSEEEYCLVADTNGATAADDSSDGEEANVERRRNLPSPTVGDTGSALSIFRKNIGKDLSTVTMPISMNEPISLLQKACEDMEYSELLDKASLCTDTMDRLMYVVVFAVSGYASSQHRIGRKPFNPMMTETYECIRPEKGFRFISEKVSHNPLVIAAHAESKNYSMWQSTKIRSKFWGKSMEFITEGTFHVTLHGSNDHFTYSKPSSWMRNMIAGGKYLEHAGEMKVVNHATEEYAIVTFKEGTGGGLFGAPTQRNDVIITLFDKNNTKCRRVVGKWSEQLAEELDMNKQTLSVLWTANAPKAEEYEKYYGFTLFSVQLNEVTSIEKGHLPKTDTRLRPDQQLYEKGRVDEADLEKQRIEQKQRDRRKEMEMQNIPWEPRWFKLLPDDYIHTHLVDPSMEQNEASTSWQFSGEYWKLRELGQWPNDLIDIW
ncbi:Oxysterol-binding protein-domain-containing protein [Spinellus fusiger]|nr:Oxysterol-binding protein-domain-containing protein [Spinellus fusiger]